MPNYLPSVDEFMGARAGVSDAPAPSDDLPDVDTFMASRPRRVSPTPQAPASPESYRITDGYGAPRPKRIHSGTDFAEPLGTPLGAAASGRVKFAGQKGGYGNAIDIEDPDGNVHRYGHLQRIGVGVGDTVGAGEQIGRVGSTGHSTGAHTHYEVRPNGGGAVDPLKTNFRPVFGQYVKPFTKLPDVDSFMSARPQSTPDASARPSAQSQSNDLPDVDSFMASRGAGVSSPSPIPTISGAGTVDSPLHLPPGNYVLDHGVQPVAASSTHNTVNIIDDDAPPPPLDFKPATVPRADSFLARSAQNAASFSAPQNDPREVMGETRPLRLHTPMGAPLHANQINDAALASYGDEYAALGLRYRDETGRDINQISITPEDFKKQAKYVRDPNSPSGGYYELPFAPTLGATRILNAYGKGGLTEAKAEALRITDEAKPKERTIKDAAISGASDVGVANAQLAHNVTMLGRALYTASVHGYDSPEYKALEAEDQKTQSQIDAARASVPADEQSLAGKVTHGVVSGVGSLPRMMAFGATGLPLEALAENLQKGVVPAGTEALKTLPLVASMGAGGALAEGMSAAGRQIAMRGLMGTTNVVSRLASGDHDIKSLVADFTSGAALPVGKGHEEAAGRFARPRILSEMGETPPVELGPGADVQSPPERAPIVQGEPAATPLQSVSVDASAQQSEAGAPAATEKRIYSSRLGKELKIIGRVTDGRLVALDEATGKRSLIKDPRAVGGNREASYVAPKTESTSTPTEAAPPAPQTEPQIAPQTPAQPEQASTTPETSNSAAGEPARFTPEPLAPVSLPESATTTQPLTVGHDATATEQSVAAMSEGEQARSDAQKLSGNLMGQFYPADDGQIVTPANREFIRNFMGDVVAPAERGRYVTSDGQISQEGITRVRNAVFARAYGETPEGVAALQKLAESPDNNVRNITTAMLHKAGRFAAQKEAIAGGSRYPLDITNDLAAALGKLSSLRDAGTTVDDYLKQSNLFGDELTPLQRRALQTLDANKRSAKAINTILDNYLRGAESAGDPRQAGFFGGKTPHKAALLEAAIQEATHEQNQRQQSTLFHTDDQGALAQPERSAGVSSDDPAIEAARGSKAPTAAAQTSGRALNNQSGAIDLDLLTLGVRPFLKHDVRPRTVGAARVIAETADSIRATLAPVSRGDDAKGAARVIRANAADMARRFDIADHSLEGAHDHFSKQDAAANLDALNRIETKQPQLDPKAQNFANTMRGLLDGRRADVQALGLNRVKDFTREYFPQAFTDPQAARKFFNNPKRGARLPTIADGEASGLTPVTTNPVDLVMLQLRQADKYVMSQRTLAEMKAQGLAKLIRVGATPPDGWTKIDESIGTIYGAPAPQGGITIRGHLYAPEPAARIINNYLSPGLGKYPVYRGWRGLSNLMNQAQLGLSFFHAGFTTLDTMVSRTAVGLEDIFRYGKPVRGLKAIASTPVSPITNLIQGSKMVREWMTPGSQGAEIASFVSAMSEGGGRARMDEFYRTTIAQNMTDAFAKGNIPGGVLRLPFAAMEKTAAPLMEWLVPRQKLGIFAEMARRELEANPNASHAERRDAMAKAWDSVDNRMGQLVYDNLFWQKSFKDLSMASVRSVGWNIGSLREIPGGAIDYAKAGGNVLRGRRPEFTHRMAYVTALPIVTGMIGGMTNYLLTGEPPKETKDYFFPRTGNMNEHGEPARISLPSYVKDIFAYSTHPLRTAGHKLHPLIGNIAEMLENKDYYGTEIRSADDPIVKQASDTLAHFGAAFVPFSVAGVRKERERGSSLSKSLLPMVGITPAPSELNQTPAQKMMRALGAARIPSGARTKEQAAASQLKRDLTRTARKGDNIDEQVQQAVDAGKLKPRDVMAINRAANETPLQSGFKKLPLADALKVYGAMNENERNQVSDILEAKKGRAKL